MSTKIAYATLVFAAQAGPITVEITWADATDEPSHGIVLYEPDTKQLAFVEFDTNYTTYEKSILQWNKWGKHGEPKTVELLHPNEVIISLLKEKLQLSDRHLAKLQDDQHRKRLESVMEFFFATAQRATDDKKSALTWAELKTLWDSQPYKSFQELEIEALHTDDDLQRLFQNSTTAYNALATEVAALHQMEEKMQAMQHEIAMLKRGQAAPRPTGPTAPSAQPTVYPQYQFEQMIAEAPQPATQTAPPSRVTRDCRTWYLLFDRHGSWDVVVNELFRAVGVNPYYQRTTSQHMAFRWFTGMVTAVLKKVEVQDPANIEEADAVNEAFTALLIETRAASGLTLSTVRARADINISTMGMAMFHDLESHAGARFQESGRGGGRGGHTNNNNRTYQGRKNGGAGGGGSAPPRK
ncbi:hypothetical protein NESM_000864100 [Novymonas esmeraldas]|uniref:Uncharacterized protein n=1 Tax=Novymonas esmeraldas TaxID=1808958 RepID=A0AAW0EZL7_9TRYP